MNGRDNDDISTELRWFCIADDASRAEPFCSQYLDGRGVIMATQCGKKTYKCAMSTIVYMSIIAFSGCTPWHEQLGFTTPSDAVHPDAVPALERGLKEGVNWSEIYNTMIEIGRPSIPAFARLLNEGFYPWEMMKAMVKIDKKDAVPHLVRSLGSRQYRVREYACQFLSKTGDSRPSVLSALELVAKHDEDDDVQEEANKALSSLKLRALSEGKISSKAHPSSSQTVPAKRHIEQPPPIPAEDRIKKDHSIVAVFPIQDSAGGFRQKTLEQLTEYLAVQLTNKIGYKVVPGDQLRVRLIEAKKDGYKACYDQSCQIELGRAVAAQKSISAKLLKIGNKCAITVSVYDLKSESSERAASVHTDCSSDALLIGVDNISGELAKP